MNQIQGKTSEPT